MSLESKSEVKSAKHIFYHALLHSPYKLNIIAKMSYFRNFTGIKGVTKSHLPLNNGAMDVISIKYTLFYDYLPILGISTKS